MGPDQPPRDRSTNGRRRNARPCRRSRAAGQPLAAGVRSVLSTGRPGASLLVVLVALTACQDVDDPRALALAASRDRLEAARADGAAAAPTEYPSLYSVPPRPQLSYSVQQRRAIVEGLVADRELARYTDQVVRYRSGQSSLPPPPEPPRAVAAVDTEGLLEPAEPAAVPAAEAPAAPPVPSPYDDDAGFGGFGDFGNDEEEDTLDSFVDDLAEDPLQEQADEVGVPGAQEEPADEDDGGFIDWLGGLFGKAEPEDPPGSTSAALAAVPAMQPAPAAVSGPVPAPAPADARSPDGPRIAVGEDGIAIDADPASASGRATRTGELAAAEATILPPPAKAEAEPDRPATPQDAAAGVASAPAKVQVERDPPVAPQGAVAVVASTPAGRILFAPQSAELPAGAGAQLAQVLAQAKAQDAVIRILGEAGVPALALDRARAVGLALVGLGARAGDLEMTLAPDARGDQARLLLAGPGSR
jgi:hypothetical protein